MLDFTIYQTLLPTETRVGVSTVEISTVTSLSDVLIQQIHLYISTHVYALHDIRYEHLLTTALISLHVADALKHMYVLRAGWGDNLPSIRHGAGDCGPTAPQR